MRLLLTRAEEDAARTRDKLRAMGHNVILSPVIQVAATGKIWPTGIVDAALATSGQAFIAHLDGLSPEARRLMPLYLVGSRTKDQARAAGYGGAATVAASAALLVFALGKLPERPRRIVYLAGRDRKPDIETAFAVIGQRLDVLEVYEARANATPSAEAIAAFRDGAVNGVLHYSRRSAILFVSAAAMMNLDIASPIHFCLSEDVATPLRKAGCPTIYVADQPTEADLLALVGHT